MVVIYLYCGCGCACDLQVVSSCAELRVLMLQPTFVDLRGQICEAVSIITSTVAHSPMIPYWIFCVVTEAHAEVAGTCTQCAVCNTLLLIFDCQFFVRLEHVTCM